jgi:hypothetical protein
MTETQAAPSVSPGRCSDHPTTDLITHAEAGIRWYGRTIAVVCPDPHHRPGAPERCRWCGGPLVPPGTPAWQVSDRREYCSSNHRLRAFRARARATST